MIKNFITKILESNDFLRQMLKTVTFFSEDKKEAVSLRDSLHYRIYSRSPKKSYPIFVPHSGQNLGILPSAGL